MKLLALLVLLAFAGLIVWGFLLAVRGAVRKYRETGSVLLESRPSAHVGASAWSVSWAGAPLIAAGVTTLSKGPPLAGLAILALGVAIMVANRIQEEKWRRGG